MITTIATAWVAAPVLASFLSGAKAPDTALHATVHPTAHANATAAGASGGGVYGSAQNDQQGGDRRTVKPGYGEGWMRFGMTSSQIEARLTPSSTYLSYRRDLSRPNAPARIALTATLGLAYWHATSVTQRITNHIAVAPSFGVLVFPRAGSFYLVARYGFQRQWALLSYTNDPSESRTVTGTHAVGAAMGWTWRNDPVAYSLELSALGAWNANASDRARAYVIVPTFAMQLVDADELGAE